MSREKTYIDEMNCAMIDEMSDAMVDDTKGSRRREFNDLGLTGRPEVADSNRHSGGSHLCEEGSAHEAIERRRSVDYSTVSSERQSRPLVIESTRTSSSKPPQNTVSGKGIAAIVLILFLIIGIAAQSAGMVITAVIFLALMFGKKNNGTNGRK